MKEAEVIALGSTGMSFLTKKLQQSLGMPVVNLVLSSLKLAEIYVIMEFRTSKVAYGSPSEKEII